MLLCHAHLCMLLINRKNELHQVCLCESINFFFTKQGHCHFLPSLSFFALMNKEKRGWDDNEFMSLEESRFPPLEDKKALGRGRVLFGLCSVVGTFAFVKVGAKCALADGHVNFYVHALCFSHAKDHPVTKVHSYHVTRFEAIFIPNRFLHRFRSGATPVKTGLIKCCTVSSCRQSSTTFTAMARCQPFTLIFRLLLKDVNIIFFPEDVQHMLSK